LPCIGDTLGKKLHNNKHRNSPYRNKALKRNPSKVLVEQQLSEKLVVEAEAGSYTFLL
jgi:hypothetical protein